MTQRPKYQINFLPESIGGYCSTACFMGVLNYFWYTQFNMKDTWDIIKLAKFGRYEYGDGLSMEEMTYAFEKLGFEVSIFSGISEEDATINYYNDPVGFNKKYTNVKYHSHIQGDYWVEGDPVQFKRYLYDFDLSKKVDNNPNIKKYFQKDVIDEIIKNQGENTLFILGVSGYVLFDIPFEKGNSRGHVVITTGIQGNDFVIYDPGPYEKPVLINKEKVLNSMNEISPYYVIMVKWNK